MHVRGLTLELPHAPLTRYGKSKAVPHRLSLGSLRAVAGHIGVQLRRLTRVILETFPTLYWSSHFACFSGQIPKHDVYLTLSVPGMGVWLSLVKGCVFLISFVLI